MERHLKRISAEILIVEQSAEGLFNRGKLLNIGAKESKYDHIILHDVDMLPVFDAVYEPLNGCTHFAGRASQFRYKHPYPTYLGGVTMFDKETFRKINGFSNNYWGWGAEDDDLYKRCIKKDVNITWKPYQYRSLHHDRRDLMKNLKNNKALLETGTDQEKDGLSSLEYKVLSANGNLKPNFEVNHLIVEI